MPAIAQLGFGWQTQLHPADKERVSEAWTKAVAPGTEFRAELRLRRHDGTYRWFDGRAVPLYGSKGEITKWIGSSTDIDDRKRFEEAQLRSQKLESLGTLAGGIAHDFNNMLLVIQGNAQLAQEMIEKDNAAQEHLVEISHASERASDLVRRILPFSRPQKARHKVIQLGPVVEEALKFARAAPPAMVEIRTNVSAQMPAVAADGTQIHQIVLNLATNAAHAIGPRGGLVEIELASTEIDPLGGGLRARRRSQPAGRPVRAPHRARHRRGHEPRSRSSASSIRSSPPSRPDRAPASASRSSTASCAAAVARVTVQSALGKGTSFHLFFPAAPEASACRRHEHGHRALARHGSAGAVHR